MEFMITKSGHGIEIPDFINNVIELYSEESLESESIKLFAFAYLCLGQIMCENKATAL